MNRAVMGRIGAVFLGLCALTAAPAFAQQYNSDNYLSKPHGVATIILTSGARNSMWMTTFSLIPRWEFTAAAYVYYEHGDPKISNGYSTSYYFKYMIFENKAQTGGVAFKAGTGLEPGYLTPDVGLKDAFQTYWMNAPVTVPFLNNRLSLDVMPGASAGNGFLSEPSAAMVANATESRFPSGENCGHSYAPARTRCMPEPSGRAR